MSFYAVARGRRTGVFNTWEECSKQITGFKGAAHKKFATRDQALAFINESSGAVGEAQNEMEDVFKSGGANQLDAKKREKITSSGSVQSIGSPILVQRLQALRGSVEQISLRFSSFVDQTQRELKDIGDQIGALLDEASVGIVKTEASAGETKEEEGPTHAKRKKVPDPDVAPAQLGELKAKGFDVENDGFVSVYTDGACESNGQKGARGGIGVWWNHGHSLNTAAPLSVSRPPTNNRAEIEAATVAVAQARAKGITRLHIKTDSQFLINCVTKWMKGWKAKGWRTATNEPVKNREELEALDRQLRNMESELVVRWTHVPGHAGVVGNEMADRLARKGAQES